MVLITSKFFDLLLGDIALHTPCYRHLQACEAVLHCFMSFWSLHGCWCAAGKLQEWTVSSEAASRRLASRAAAIQSAMQQLSSQVLEGNAAADGAAAAGFAARASTISGSGASNSSSGAAEAAGGSEGAVSAATAAVLDQMAGLQQLMQAEAHKHQEVFDSALKVRWCCSAQRYRLALAWLLLQLIVDLSSSHRGVKRVSYWLHQVRVVLFVQ